MSLGFPQVLMSIPVGILMGNVTHRSRSPVYMALRGSGCVFWGGGYSRRVPVSDPYSYPIKMHQRKPKNGGDMAKFVKISQIWPYLLHFWADFDVLWWVLTGYGYGSLTGTRREYSPPRNSHPDPRRACIRVIRTRGSHYPRVFPRVYSWVPGENPDLCPALLPTMPPLLDICELARQ